MVATPICRMLEVHLMALAFSLAMDNAGNSMPARMAMMAITTRSSIKVKPLCLERNVFMSHWVVRLGTTNR